MKPLTMLPSDSYPLPAETPKTAIAADPGKTAELRPGIVQAISTVFDPEIPVNIWELGLVYEIEVDASGVALITMTLTSPGCPAAQSLPVEDLGKLSVLSGVREFPVRVKCASLAWHTLKAALEREQRTSTE